MRKADNMLRVVIDTNVFIRYLIRPSAAVEALIDVHFLDGHLQIVTAPELLKELDDVLRRRSIRRIIHADEGEALFNALLQLAIVLPTLGEVPSYSRDAKDDRFVACAIAGQADYLVT